MQKLVMDYLNEWKEKQRKRRRTGIVAVLLVVMVAGGIISSLTEAGIAMTGDVKCGKEEHAHTDRCYENVLICGQEESEGHQHSDTCYQEEQTLVCGQEESEEHQHTDACYQTEAVLICGTEESGGHTHTDACYEKQLVCGMEEHSHSDVCYIDEEAGVEEPSEWDAQYADTQWTESWNENLVMAAEKQLGYEEVKENYITTDEGVRKGYTRYGQFAGNAYMDWDAAFVNFCIYYSKIAESALFPQETDSEKWIDEFVKIHEENGTVLTAPEELGVYIPEAGDIIFFHREGEETGTQMGIVSSYNKENNQIKVIEGNYENSVRENTYDAGNEKIATYLKMAELEQMYKGAGSEAAEETQTSDKTEADDVKETESEESPKEETEDVADSDSKADEKSEEQNSEDADDIKAEVVPEEAEDENAQKIEALLRTDGAGNEKESRENLLSGKMDFGTMKSFGIRALLGERASDTSGDADAGEVRAAKPHDDETCDPKWAAQIKPDPDSNGKIKLELLYGDAEKSNHGVYCPTCYTGGEAPEVEGMQVRPDPNISSRGFIKITTEDMDGSKELSSVSVTIHIPSDYIKETNEEGKSLIGFDPVSQIEGLLLPETKVTKTSDGKYYELTMTFKEFVPTYAATYGFYWAHLGENIPADYQEKIYATLQCGEQEDATYENVYRPLYDEPNITKYVNTNQYDSMAEDGTKVSAIGSDKDGFADPNKYVSFWYKLGGHSNWVREYQQINLTDILPTYTRYVVNDKGEYVYDSTTGEKVKETALAVFDASENPGWVLSNDGKGVTRVFETDKTCADPDTGNMKAVDELKGQIEAAELKLRFPYCVLDETEDLGGVENPFLTKRLTNKVIAECVPSNPSIGEQNDIVDDSLVFVLTTQRPGAGFGKSNSYNVIVDTQQMRSTPYQWGMILENTESDTPMRNITMKDYELDQLKVKDAEGNEILDERNRLRIHSIRIMRNYNNKSDEISAEERVDYIEAFRADGKEPDRYKGSKFTGRTYDGKWKGWYETLVLNPEVEYESFVIHMKDDYVLNKGEKIDVRVYTTFKDPTRPHYDENNPSMNIYHNGAQVEYWIDNTCFTGWGQNHFELERAAENIWIEKENFLFSKNINQLQEGDTGYWLLKIEGILAEKDYSDLRIIDLLPEALEYTGPIGTGGEYITKTEIIKNYKNTNRTAIISYLNAEKVKEALQGKASATEYNYIQITYGTKVRENPPLGTDYNEVFLLSDEFEPITNQNKSMDKYDVDDDKNTEEFHRFARDACTVIAQSQIFAEKWIAPETGDDWSKRDVLKMGVGDKFRYRLRIFNGADNDTDLIVYDVLPNNDDPTISNESKRDSEYRVVLSEYVDFGGYTTYYTDSESVYTKKMAEAVSEAGWYTKEEIGEGKAIGNLEDVTAIRIVANEGTIVKANEKVDFDIPVKAVLAKDSRNILETKTAEDAQSGIVTYLKARNTFGYHTKNYSNNMESNFVVSEVPFAGFVVKKTEAGDSEKVLSGVKFKLEKKVVESSGNEKWVKIDENGNVVTEENKNVTTDDKGLMTFKNLEEGIYRLTEIEAPEGYLLLKSPIDIEIKLDRNLMSYSVEMKCGNVSNDHKGNSDDPFIVENLPLYELPSTGGIGIYWYMFGGVLLMMAAVLIAYRKRCKGVLES